MVYWIPCSLDAMVSYFSANLWTLLCPLSEDNWVRNGATGHSVLLTFETHWLSNSFAPVASTNFSPISKKTTSAIPFSQPIEQDTALRPFCYVLWTIFFPLWTMTTFLFFFCSVDLSAAFHTIDHQILLSRLNSVFWHSVYCTPMVSLIPLRQISVHFSQ